MTDYICPLCQTPLSAVDRSLRCCNNHCFDIAKEGYVNLLPVQYKHSKDPGDNKAMVNARRAFLDKGFYQPLADRITALYREKFPANKEAFLLDAGCGEGFYTHQHKCADNNVYGVDIAKNAVRIAAKRYKECSFSVGTLAKLAFADQQFDWLYSIYAPVLEQEFYRVLKPGGFLLTVTPAKKHLLELKSLIYQEAKLHDSERNPIEHMPVILEERLSYVMNFNQGQDIVNLLAMTPFAFKAGVEVVEKLRDLSEFSCQADFLIRLYQKTEKSSAP